MCSSIYSVAKETKQYSESIGDLKLPFFLKKNFLGLHLRHMEVPRLRVESELQLPAYAKATATRDPSCICNLLHSLQQHPVRMARRETHILMDISWVLNSPSQNSCSVHFYHTAQWPSHIYTYVLFLMLSAIMVYLKWMDIVPCAVQQDREL